MQVTLAYTNGGRGLLRESFVECVGTWWQRSKSLLRPLHDSVGPLHSPQQISRQTLFNTLGFSLPVISSDKQTPLCSASNWSNTFSSLLFQYNQRNHCADQSASDVFMYSSTNMYVTRAHKHATQTFMQSVWSQGLSVNSECTRGSTAHNSSSLALLFVGREPPGADQQACSAEVGECGSGLVQLAVRHAVHGAVVLVPLRVRGQLLRCQVRGSVSAARRPVWPLLLQRQRHQDLQGRLARRVLRQR